MWEVTVPVPKFNWGSFLTEPARGAFFKGLL